MPVLPPEPAVFPEKLLDGMALPERPDTPEDGLRPVTAVEIRQGRLAGMRGKIVRTASRRRWVVEVKFIQRGASVPA
jgi:hypothetical protein